ncbi:hypothetical protein [Paracoccus saliphilus]|uniref:Uncharacterized protein n=1 Tax=Paracoccus saliphilus TaxID=405559 RepID=A0AA45W5T2_9RHOB|nr:hypothetical protein [Paracoccus saliphilus]WCR05616.1 hypothetical protein JHX88_21280 [Paracoccus saliphilus]SIS96341.1 hypothetical protein SAMN05421772_11073 [Paracoccus saliphilus]
MEQIIDVVDPIKHFAYHLIESDYWRKGKRSTTVLLAQEVNMQTLTLTERELTVLRDALEIARDRYQDNACNLRHASPAHEHLAEQFDRQGADAERLMEKLDA